MYHSTLKINTMRSWITLFTSLFIFSVAQASNPAADCVAAFEYEVSGATVYFIDGSTADPGPILEWFWDFGDGTTSTESNPVHTYAEPGEYDVCLTIHSDGGCFDDKCESNIPVDGGGADCVVTASLVAIDGSSGHFIAEVTPAADIVTYTWNWGDGGPLYSETTTGAASDPWHTYSDPGFYTVCVTITTGAGCTDEYCFEIEIPAAGDCYALYEYTLDGGLVHFYEAAGGGDIVSYSWDFGDGSISTDPNPSHIWAAEGTYLVCLTIETATGCSDTYCHEITIGGGGDCTSDFEFDLDGLTVHYFETAHAGGGGADIVSYYWDFGDGTSSDAPNPIHTYTEEGTYLVCLTIVTNTGCTSTYCHEVHVELPTGDCLASYVVSSIELTPDGYVIHIENTSTSGGDITTTTWYYGDGTIGDSYDAEHVYTESGTYIICLVIATADGCVDEYCTSVVVGEPGCSSFFEFTTDGPAVHYFEGADGGGYDIVSYLWSFGDGTFSDGPNPIHIYTEAGTYEVCLTITTASGCVSTYCHIVIVEEGGEFCAAGFETDGIEETPDGWMAHFANTSIGSDLYHWTFGDGGVSELPNPSHLFETAGIYAVCLTIGVGGGDCFDNYCEELFVGGDDDCVNAGIIDSTMDCVEVYEPVCGCDNVTYDNSCYAQYYGGVVYWTEGACGTTAVQEENIFGSVQVSPNPANQQLRVNYHLESGADVRIEMISLTGQSVIIPIYHQSVAGNYSVEINTSTLSEGIYFIRLAAAGDAQMVKVIVTH